MPDRRTDASMPRAFFCPLTKQPFKQPVLASDGWTYEASALATWRKDRGDISPKTRRPLDAPAVPNRVLGRALREYQEQAEDAAPAFLRDEWQYNAHCPVGLEPMLFPVRLGDGNDYDLTTAKNLVRKRGRSPLTEEPFAQIEALRPDRAMQQLAQDVQRRRNETPALTSSSPFATTVYPHDALTVRSLHLRPEPIGAAAPELLAATDAIINAVIEGRPLPPPVDDTWLVYRVQERLADKADEIVDLGHAILDQETRAGGWSHLLQLSIPWVGIRQTGPRKLWTEISAASDELRVLTALSYRTPMSEQNYQFCEELADFMAPRIDPYGSAMPGLRSSWAFIMTSLACTQIAENAMNLPMYGAPLLPVALFAVPLITRGALEVAAAVAPDGFGKANAFAGMRGGPTPISRIAAMSPVITVGLGYVTSAAVSAGTGLCLATGFRAPAAYMAPTLVASHVWTLGMVSLGAVTGCGLKYWCES